ncbi:MAG TPA: glycerophosphodiester phosphodiesterase family protein [Tepidisphaeraceae bacterium]|jgi:glycerophosphoryl diester phosphodiesterase
MSLELPLIIAHRGESFDAPENTMAAFDLAWQRGAGAIELDVHVTSDGHVIACHDDNTSRITRQSSNLTIKNSPLAALLALDVGSWKHPDYAGEKIPLLFDILKKMPPGKIVFIEIKPSVENIRPIIDVMKQAGRARDEMRIISFKDAIIAEYNHLWPDGPEAYLLTAFEHDNQTNLWKPAAEDLIQRAKVCNAAGLDLQNAPPLNANMIQAIHAASLQCYVWTEDDPVAARQFVAAGIDGITTNRAAWITEQLR